MCDVALIEATDAENLSSNKYSTPNESSPETQSTISDFNGLDFTNIEDTPDDVHSTTALLHYCTRAILKPYHRFLTCLGWRPISSFNEDSIYLKVANVLYLILVVLIMLLGFVLQGVLFYRRDGWDILSDKKHVLTNAANILNGTLFLGLDYPKIHCDYGYFVFPNILPLLAFVYTLYLFRFSEYEQLHILMEKTFLQTHQSVTYCTQPKLCKTLWLFLSGCILWILISCITQGMHLASYIVYHKSSYVDCSCYPMDICDKILLNMLIVIMLLTTVFHDIVHITILWAYGIQCELLISLMKNICERIRSRISLQEAIKEIEECNKFVKYLNEEMSVSVAILVLYSAILTALGLIYLMKHFEDKIIEKIEDQTEAKKEVLLLFSLILSVITWMSSFAFPIVQAARLAGAYSAIKDIGHHVRSRPFGYQNTRRDELDSFVLYTSTLKTKIKLFCVSINSGAITIFIAISILIFFLYSEVDE